MKTQTIREALDEKRFTLKGVLKHLYLCKRELFYEAEYLPHVGSVYPVSLKIAKQEAEFFKVELTET